MCERFGVEDREGPGVGSSEAAEGADGERIAARECGEGIVAVRDPEGDPRHVGEEWGWVAVVAR